MKQLTLTKKGNEVIPKNYKYTEYERETIVNFNDAEENCRIYTCSKSLQNELTKKGYTLITKDNNSKTFEVHKKFISFRTVEKVETKKDYDKTKVEKMQAARRQKYQNSNKN